MLLVIWEMDNEKLINLQLDIHLWTNDCFFFFFFGSTTVVGQGLPLPLVGLNLKCILREARAVKQNELERGHTTAHKAWNHLSLFHLVCLCPVQSAACLLNIHKSSRSLRKSQTDRRN